MKTITKPVYGPDLLKYTGEYHIAENVGEVSDVVSKMGLSLDDVNEALRQAKKRLYNAALESTPQSRIDALVASAKNTGAFSDEDISAMVESIRAKVQNTLPSGLVPVKGEDGKQIVGKPRGRAAATAVTETPATT